MHFHWSAEHTVDGFRDPLELHFVHYNDQYENFSMAAQHKDGIAVVAVLFEVRVMLVKSSLEYVILSSFFKCIIKLINCIICIIAEQL